MALRHHTLYAPQGSKGYRGNLWGRRQVCRPAPRVEPEAVSATLEFMGKKGLPIETFADNSIVDRLVREGFIDQVYKKR